jgi:hypothetical protein
MAVMAIIGKDLRQSWNQEESSSYKKSSSEENLKI